MNTFNFVWNRLNFINQYIMNITSIFYFVFNSNKSNLTKLYSCCIQQKQLNGQVLPHLHDPEQQGKYLSQEFPDVMQSPDLLR